MRQALIETLAAAGCIEAADEADQLIAAAATGRGRLDDLVERRTQGEPLAWITGWVTFCDRTVAVDTGVYVPRWQTEALATRAAGLFRSGGIAVDLCTGTGAIAVVLAATVPTAQVLATEIDDRAIACAERNGVTVLPGWLDDPLPETIRGHVDVLTAVVPYVPSAEIDLLPRDVRAFESRFALDGGLDGTDLLVAVARRSSIWVRPGGWVLLELGGDQADPIGAILDGEGFVDLDVMVDAEGDSARIRGADGRWMTRQNRVTPLGELIADPARGLVHGNRGCLHDDHGRISRHHAGTRWIVCRLEFRGWRRSPLMQPGRYTELFFLDEATAFAAGHRPCALCRREDYVRFGALWRDVHPDDRGADAIDRRLHDERLEPATSVQRLHAAVIDELPDGAFIFHTAEPCVIVGDRLLRWTPAGYTDPVGRPRGRQVDVITPASLVTVLRRGWSPDIPFLHHSARAA